MQLENVIEIGAARSVVWNATVDLESWPNWTPTVTSIRREDDGTFDVGSAAVIKQPGMPEARWVVTSLVPQKSFTWETRVRGIRMIATHELADSDQGTKCTLRVQMSGFAAQLLWPFLRRSVQQALVQENAGMKQYCESLSVS